MGTFAPAQSGNSAARAINDLRTVAGYSRGADGVNHAVTWDREGRISDLGIHEGGSHSNGWAINNFDVVAGTAVTKENVTHAAKWLPGKKGPIDLGTLPGGRRSYAYGINDREEVVGPSTWKEPGTHAAKWDRDGNITDLGTLPGAAQSTVFDINNWGTAVGWSGGQPVKWTSDNKIVTLEPLHGKTGGAAWGINDKGEIVGASFGEGLTHVATKWTPGGKPIQLKGGVGNTAAVAINERGEVAGNGGYKEPTPWTALYWDPDGNIQDLGHLPGDTQSRTSGINNTGHISGHSSGNVAKAVYWTPEHKIHRLCGLTDICTTK